MSAKFTVGQVVWYVGGIQTYQSGSEFGEPQEATITKIGRKWVYFRCKDSPEWRDDDRFAPEERKWRGGWQVDGGDWRSPGTVYDDLQVFQDLEEKDRLDRFLKNQFGYHNQELTLDQLRRIAAIVKEGKE
ncbi:MAG: hypothetical protein NXI32_04835 [bacterium]|nr:hypothetical protein [bacterium]